MGLIIFDFEYRISSVLENYCLDYKEYDTGEENWTYCLLSITGDWSGNVYDFYKTIANSI